MRMPKTRANGGVVYITCVFCVQKMSVKSSERVIFDTHPVQHPKNPIAHNTQYHTNPTAHTAVSIAFESSLAWAVIKTNGGTSYSKE